MREVRALPADCRLVLPPGARGVQRWQALVLLEHCDRIKRLQRLSQSLPPDKQPIFFEGVVPAERLPAEFGVDVPVLRVVFPERTFFDTADAKLRPEADEVASVVSESLRREPPDVAMFIAGHADERGNRDYNEALSIDRADAIARRIVRDGVNWTSIWRVGFGEDMPLVSGMSPYAWDRNRRIEFLFAAKPEAAAVWLADQQRDQLCQARNSAEVAQCKRGLAFRDGYDIIEVKEAPRRSVRPATPPPRRVDPSSARDRARVAPSTERSRVPMPTASAMIGVTPAGERRIRIDPINRRVPPQRVDL